MKYSVKRKNVIKQIKTWRVRLVKFHRRPSLTSVFHSDSATAAWKCAGDLRVGAFFLEWKARAAAAEDADVAFQLDHLWITHTHTHTHKMIKFGHYFCAVFSHTSERNKNKFSQR